MTMMFLKNKSKDRQTEEQGFLESFEKNLKELDE